MGTVELVARGEDRFERLYARKRLHPHLRADDEFRTMFMDEARVAGLVRHPNVVSVLDLGEDITLELGDSIPINPAVVIGAELYAWGQTPGLSCYNCPTPWVYIFHPMGYSLTVTSEDGCTASDSIFVDVHATRDVYIPNAFSPNGDGINDLFNVFGGAEVLQVKSFKVFDRWGEHVFALRNFPPNNPGIGWDGSFKGKEMQGAVFAWTAEVAFLDDVVIFYKGDVMVVR